MIKNFKNLFLDKNTIIGKIKSINLVEVMDEVKRETLIAAKLADLLKKSDMTELSLRNKKTSRKINSFKHLNKKKIFKSNRIKILYAISSIKKDSRFEFNLEDITSYNNLPISLWYYSNLKPLYKFKHKLSVRSSSNSNNSIINNNYNIEDKSINKLEPVLSAYLRELSTYNRETKGLRDYYSRVIGYNFNYNTNLFLKIN